MVRRRRRGRVQLRAIGAAEHTAAAGTRLRCTGQKLHRARSFVFLSASRTIENENLFEKKRIEMSNNNIIL